MITALVLALRVAAVASVFVAVVVTVAAGTIQGRGER